MGGAASSPGGGGGAWRSRGARRCSRAGEGVGVHRSPGPSQLSAPSPLVWGCAVRLLHLPPHPPPHLPHHLLHLHQQLEPLHHLPLPPHPSVGCSPTGVWRRRCSPSLPGGLTSPWTHSPRYLGNLKLPPSNCSKHVFSLFRLE